MTRQLARGAIAAQAIFVIGMLVLGAIEGHGYSAASDDVSDLSALTAHHAVAMLIVTGVAGALTIAFAIGALRPALALAGKGALAAWLVALSLPALDSLGDMFFRLDCRAADAGCSMSDAASSWHGKMHIVVFGVAAIATVIAPFALARRMRLVEGWERFAEPTRIFGFIVIGGLVVAAATGGTDVQGLGQRVAIVVVCSGVAVLAARTARDQRYVETKNAALPT